MDNNFPLALPVDTVLAGQYIIKKILGQGGFGITYMAVDYKTNEKVAIKEFYPDALAARTQNMVIPHTGERGESYQYGLSCFMQEAETLAEFIGIDGIVKIHSYFEENGTAYFVMDYVEGQSFEEYIRSKGGKISYEEAEQILVPVMDALSAVHKRGIIHRDVTPDNIYITKEGNVKLLDFGAARYSLGDKSRSLDVVLKHGFAPKEQYTRHGKQGPFTDIYSLGASFYFAITGKKPMDSIDRLEEDDLIPPGNLGVSIPGAKEDAILKAMAVQPADRFQSMEAFKQALLGESAPTDNTQPSGQPQEVQQVVFTAPEQNQQINYGTTMQQPLNQQMTYPANPSQNVQNTLKKKNILLVLMGVAVGIIVIFAALMIIGKNANKDKSEAENSSIQKEFETSTDGNDDQENEDQDRKTEVAREDETQVPVESEPIEPEKVHSTETGTFDSLAVNNTMNFGTLCCSEEHGIWMHSEGNGLVRAEADRSELKYKTTDDIESISVSGDKVYFLSGGRPMYYSITDDKVYDMPELSMFGKINLMLANEYGRFVIYDDQSDPDRYCMGYVSLESGLRPYYYFLGSPTGVTIADEYIYFIEEGQHKITRVRLEDFGINENSEEVFYSNKNVVIERIVADGGYIYGYTSDAENEMTYIFRVDEDNPENVAYSEFDLGGNKEITALNVYNGYIYFVLSFYEDLHSDIVGINTHEDGWSESDIQKLNSTEEEYCLFGIILDPYDGISFFDGVKLTGEIVYSISDMAATHPLRFFTLE